MRSRLTALVAALLLIGVVPQPAHAAAPNVPTLISPADGSTAAGTDVTLSVSASDPDGGGLDVRFEGRKAGATVGGSSEPFTIVALPDTQNYTNSGRQGTISQQTQWVVDTRSQLNTAMVVQLGDLVNNYDNATQWGYVSTGLKVLDDAKVPNTVVGGNHDFDNATPGSFTLYDTYFPPSRYQNADWIPATARYGGYLGQNLFGPDPVDQRNMDNFALFNAGGQDFLVLNLEWEAPQYALDWGAKVLAAHPDRIAIVVTHAFVAENGNRSTITERAGGGTPPNTIWNNFVSQNCSIRLVLNGHYHNSTGEARRTDQNRCGDPVHQVLSNYQSRSNGGDGWLRYYTFDPAADTMTATTYSPKLNQHETDANSAFTLPFDLPDTEPAPFTTIDTVHLNAAGTATATWTGLDADAEYEWRAVADDGTTTATSPVWKVKTPAPTPTELARDDFSRTGSRWGSAEVGGAWTDSGAANFATDGSHGQVTVTRAGSGPAASLDSLSARDISLTTDFALAAAPAGGAFSHIAMARVRGTTFYSLNSRLETNGALRLYVSRVVSGAETQLKTTLVSGFGYTAGERLKVRLDVHGSGSTTIEGKVWRAAANEPSTPMVSTTDSTAGLQAAGAVGLKFYTSGGTTSLPTRVSVDGFQVRPAGDEPPPTNQPPVAAFQATPKSWQVSVDASASSDDGTITGYAWDFGDGNSGTGRTTSHTYSADGTYAVKLTVTDNQGATASLTRQVTVTNTAPTASFTTTTADLKVSVDASASSDDGTITGYAWDFGDGNDGTGKTASHTYSAAGSYTVELTVTDDTGRTGKTSKQVTVTQPPAAEVVAADGFARTVPSAWGRADTGGNWAITSTTMFAVDGSEGLVTIPSGGKGPIAWLSSTSVRDVSIVTDFALDAAPAGAAYSHQVLARMSNTSTFYMMSTRLNPNGSLQLYLSRVVSGAETQLKSVTFSTFRYLAGERVRLRLDVSGTGTTSLEGRIWRSTDSEPAAPQVTATDTASALQGAGALGIKAYTSSGITSLPLQASVTSFRSTRLGV